MRFLPPDYVNDLTAAVYASVTSVDDVVQLVNAPPLSKDFDAISARNIALKKNVADVCQAAFNEGWAIELFDAARLATPDNPQLRAFAAIVAALPEGMPSAASRSGRPSLECGRATQWVSAQRYARAAEHQIILVMGEFGQASLHFRERMQTYLTDPRCSPLIIQWLTRPHSQAEYLSPIADVLKCTVETLPATLASRLAVQNIVLLHDRIREAFDDPTLMQYFSEWLPGLVAGGPFASRLKAVQPIEWPPDDSTGLFGRLFRGGSEGHKGRGGAVALKDRLIQHQKEWMPVVGLKDLTNLTEEELADFFDASVLRPVQKNKLLGAVHECRPVPEEQFESIDNHWNEVLSLT